MPEKRAFLAVTYRHRPYRLAKLMSVPEREARAALRPEPVTDRRLPEQDPESYRRADRAERRTRYRPCSKDLGHRLAALSEEQRALMLGRYRDGLSWKQVCRKTGYSESGAMKLLRRAGVREREE